MVLLSSHWRSQVSLPPARREATRKLPYFVPGASRDGARHRLAGGRQQSSPPVQSDLARAVLTGGEARAQRRSLELLAGRILSRPGGCRAARNSHRRRPPNASCQGHVAPARLRPPAGGAGCHLPRLANGTAHSRPRQVGAWSHALVVIDPFERRIVSREAIGGTLVAQARTHDGLALLLAPIGRIGPARLLLVDSAGDQRSITLADVPAGVGRSTLNTPSSASRSQHSRSIPREHARSSFPRRGRSPRSISPVDEWTTTRCTSPSRYSGAYGTGLSPQRRRRRQRARRGRRCRWANISSPYPARTPTKRRRAMSRRRQPDSRSSTFASGRDASSTSTQASFPSRRERFSRMGPPGPTQPTRGVWALRATASTAKSASISSETSRSTSLRLRGRTTTSGEAGQSPVVIDLRSGKVSGELDRYRGKDSGTRGAASSATQLAHRATGRLLPLERWLWRDPGSLVSTPMREGARASSPHQLPTGRPLACESKAAAALP